MRRSSAARSRPAGSWTSMPPTRWRCPACRDHHASQCAEARPSGARACSARSRPHRCRMTACCTTGSTSRSWSRTPRSRPPTRHGAWSSPTSPARRCSRSTTSARNSCTTRSAPTCAAETSTRGLRPPTSSTTPSTRPRRTRITRSGCSRPSPRGTVTRSSCTTPRSSPPTSAPWSPERSGSRSPRCVCTRRISPAASVPGCEPGSTSSSPRSRHGSPAVRSR